MRRAAVLMIISLGACGKSDPKPRTRYFTSVPALQERLNRECVPASRGRMIHAERSAPKESRMVGHDFCAVRERYGRSGLLPIESAGDASYPGEICRLQIGPGPLIKPLDPEFVLQLIIDPVLSLNLRQVFAQTDFTRAFDLDTTIAGVSVYATQNLGVLGPTIEIALDGCGRVEDPSELATTPPSSGSKLF